MEALLLLIGFGITVWQVWIEYNRKRQGQRPQNGQHRRSQYSEGRRYGDPMQDIFADALDKLPPIPNSPELFSGTSAKFRRKLSPILGPEYAYSITQLTAQQLEAVRKKSEIGQRWALRIEEVKAKYDALDAIDGGEQAMAQKLLAMKRKAERQLQGRPEELYLLYVLTAKHLADVVNEGGRKHLISEATLVRLFMEGYRQRLLADKRYHEEVELRILEGVPPHAIPYKEIYEKHHRQLPNEFTYVIGRKSNGKST